MTISHISQNHSNLPVKLMVTGIMLTTLTLLASGVISLYFISNSIPINYLCYAVGGAVILGSAGIASMIKSVMLNKKLKKENEMLKQREIAAWKAREAVRLNEVGSESEDSEPEVVSSDDELHDNWPFNDNQQPQIPSYSAQQQAQPLSPGHSPATGQPRSPGSLEQQSKEAQPLSPGHSPATDQPRSPGSLEQQSKEAQPLSPGHSPIQAPSITTQGKRLIIFDGINSYTIESPQGFRSSEDESPINLLI